MQQPSREDLLGYLLGALEAEDHRRVDRALNDHESLRDELTLMRQRLVPLVRVEETEPKESFPAGLARRTCEHVAREIRATEVAAYEEGDQWGTIANSATVTANSATANSATANSATANYATANSAADELVTSGRRMTDISHQRRLAVGSWTLADYVIASTVAVLVMGMIAPALLASRNQSRLLACQDNLRRIGTGLYNYAENHSDRFIGLEKEGPFNVAGSYAPVLLSDGYIDRENVFFCSAATTANQGNRGNQGSQGNHDGAQQDLHIPTREELQRAYYDNREQLAQLQAVMGGSYGYTLGYCENGEYVCPVNLGRSFRVIMADAPSYELQNNASANHGGAGQNLLFEDGSIQFARSTSIGFPADSIFENRHGLVAAGADVNDSVIGSSNATAWISGLTTAQ